MKTQRLLVALLTLLAWGTCAGKDSCFDCHRVMEGTSLRFTNDIHFAMGISCARCHGGDQTETNQNIAMNASRGFKLRVQRAGVPQFCGNCHSDRKFMGQYDPHLPVDQLADYEAGVHGRLLAAGRKHAAECVDCHGVHDIRVPSDPLSAVSPQRISKTCAKCHGSTEEVFLPTRHGKLFVDDRRPGCTVCHTAHDTEPATTAMLTGPTSVCARCHKAGSPQLKLAADMAGVLAGLEAGGADTKDALARARVAVHSLDLAAVKRAAEPVSAAPDGDGK